MAIDETRAFRPIAIALLTVSDTRDAMSDTSGDLLAARIVTAGHTLAARMIERDDVGAIAARLNGWVDDETIDCIVTTGGTGLTGRDVTPEALDRVKSRDIPGFGELFRWLSYKTIGTSTIQSRACAVLARWRGRILNIHPSLLPAYKGLDTHARALAAGDAVAGCSVHLVTEELDAGEVLARAEVSIEPGDTPELLAHRVLMAEHALYPRTLTEFVSR